MSYNRFVEGVAVVATAGVASYQLTKRPKQETSNSGKDSDESNKSSAQKSSQ